MDLHRAGGYWRRGGPKDLEILFHSKEMFQAGLIECKTYDDEAKTKPKNYVFKGYSIHGRLIPAIPTTTFEFLVDENIIQLDHYQTIARLLDWSRQKLYHFFNGYLTGNLDQHWQYRGEVPAKRIIEKTLYTGEYKDSYPEPEHWTAGCRGTTYFYRAVLRGANIPVQAFKESCGGHVMPVFWTIGHALSHGDDPYTSLTHATPPYPADLLLIPNFTFQFWFMSPEAECPPGNVGRQVLELAIEKLPDELLKKYCEDINEGRGHAEGQVYQFFFAHMYSLSYLESKNLWGRTALKASELGYCETIIKAPFLKKIFQLQ